MKESLCANRAAGKAGDRRRDRERLHLVERDVDAHAARRGLAVADRDERAAGRRTQQIERADDGQDQDAEAEEIERRTVARHRRAEQRQRLDPHALIAVGHAFPARQDLLDDEGKGNRRDHEVDALQPQRRESDQSTDHAGQKAGGEEVDRKRHVVLLQVARGVGADREKRGVTERSLAGKAGEDQQAHADGGVDADEHQLAHQVAGEHERCDRQQHQQRAVGPDIARMRQAAGCRLRSRS